MDCPKNDLISPLAVEKSNNKFSWKCAKREFWVKSYWNVYIVLKNTFVRIKELQFVEFLEYPAYKKSSEHVLFLCSMRLHMRQT